MAINKLAIVFPGQGSQSVGMLAEIAQHFPEVKSTFEEASAVLHYDLWQLVQHGPAASLDMTMHTQPAVLTSSYAIWRILHHYKITPQLMAGHSLGEYTALVCAQSLKFSDAVGLVAQRGQFMQEAVPQDKGAMAAIIGLTDALVDSICSETKLTDEVLSSANYNSLGQVVIAGHKPAVERAMQVAKEKGAKLVSLIPVSVPSHCALMQPAAKRMTQSLEHISIQVPSITVINNVAAKAYDSVESIRTGLIQQLYQPVRWVQTIETLAKEGVANVIECGPGKILTGLNKRINKHMQYHFTSDLANLRELIHLYQGF